MPHFCDCGKPIERKAYESAKAAEKRRYCDSTCRARYYKYPTPALKFGYPRGQEKRLELGVMAYMYNQPRIATNDRYRWGSRD